MKGLRYAFNFTLITICLMLAGVVFIVAAPVLVNIFAKDQDLYAKLPWERKAWL